MMEPRESTETLAAGEFALRRKLIARQRLSATETGGEAAGAGGRTWPAGSSAELRRDPLRLRSRGGDHGDDDPPPLPHLPLHGRVSPRPGARLRGWVGGPGRGGE